jgi:transposase
MDGGRSLKQRAIHDRAYLRAAKARLLEAMDRGMNWQDAAAEAGLLVSRVTAYRLWLRACCEGPSAFEDRRHRHPAKLRTPIQDWIVAHCQNAPHTPSHILQGKLADHFGLTISIRQINRVRAARAVRTVRPRTPKKTP